MGPTALKASQPGNREGGGKASGGGAEERAAGSGVLGLMAHGGWTDRRVCGGLQGRASAWRPQSRRRGVCPMACFAI